MDYKKIDEFVLHLVEASTPERTAWNVEKLREGKKASWNYIDGCMLTALMEMSRITGDEQYFQFAGACIDYFLEEDGTIRTFHPEAHNLDDINEGRVLFSLYGHTGKEKYRRAADKLMEQLRREGGYPVLFLTARGEDEDKFKGFGLGADDYVVKPFLPRELILRITAILRRSYKGENPLVKLRGSEIDFDRAEVVRYAKGMKDGEHISLTAKEHDILAALCRNAGRIVTIDALCEAAWGDNPFGYENSLMAHIRRIREKIEADPSHPVSLITVKGLGYKLMIESYYPQSHKNQQSAEKGE